MSSVGGELILNACWVDLVTKNIYQALTQLCFSQSFSSQPSKSWAELWSAEASQAVDPRVLLGGRGANMNHTQCVGVQEH